MGIVGSAVGGMALLLEYRDSVKSPGSRRGVGRPPLGVVPHRAIRRSTRARSPTRSPSWRDSQRWCAGRDAPLVRIAVVAWRGRKVHAVEPRGDFAREKARARSTATCAASLLRRIGDANEPASARALGGGARGRREAHRRARAVVARQRSID
jgi:hypothetical protein